MLSALRSLWLPAAVVLVVLAWIELDSLVGWTGIQLPRLGAFLMIAGAALGGWCAAIFFRVGKGTPMPFERKTMVLVTSGPYGVVRNPMMWGAGTVLVGLAFWLGSVGLWFGFVSFLIFVHFFVRFYEEPDMQRRFGQQYLEYCRRVPRWFPGRRGNELAPLAERAKAQSASHKS